MPTKERLAKARRAGQAGKTTVLQVQMPPESEPEPEATEEQRSADADLAALDGDNPRAPYVILYRVNRRTGQRSRVAKLDTSIVDGEFVTEEFGGGKFIGKKFRPGAKSGFEYDGTINFDIDETLYPPKVPSWLREAAAPASAIALNGAHGSSFLDAQLMNLFTMQQQQHAAALEAQRAQQQAQLEIQRQGNLMLQAFIERMAAQATTPAPAPPPPTDLMPIVTALLGTRTNPLELLAQLETIRAKTAAPTPAEGVIALLEKGMALGRNRNAPAAEATDEGWLGFLKTVTPEGLGLIKQLVAGRISVEEARARGAGVAPRNGTPPAATATVSTPTLPAPTTTAASPPAIPSAAAPVPAAAASTPPAADPTMLPVWVPFVRPHLPQLIEWANDDVDPGVYSVVLLDRIRKAGHEAIARPLLESPTFAMDLLAAFPELQPRAEWFAELFQAVREELNPPEDEEDAIEGDG